MSEDEVVRSIWHDGEWIEVVSEEVLKWWTLPSVKTARRRGATMQGVVFSDKEPPVRPLRPLARRDEPGVSSAGAGLLESIVAGVSEAVGKLRSEGGSGCEVNIEL